jgi:hypothetical protein
MKLAIEQLHRALKAGHRPFKPGEYEIDCPMCLERTRTPDESHNLGINLLKGCFHCWRCGWHGGLRDLVEQLDREGLLDTPHIDLAEARRRLAKVAPPPLPLKPSARPWPPGTVDARTSRCQSAKLALAYLDRRGVRGAFLERLRPHVTEEPPVVREDGKRELDFRGRALLPCYLAGQLVYWVGRTYGSLEPKALNPTFPADVGKPIWGLDDIEVGGPQVICEGILSALPFPHSVAVLGDALTPMQLALLLSRAPSVITLAFDPDAAGRAGAQRASKQLVDEGFNEIRIATLPEGLDGGDLMQRGLLSEIPKILGAAQRYKLTDLARQLSGGPVRW